MSDCNFSIGFTQPADEVINKVRTQIQSQGGTFNGDESSGSFSVSAMGSNIAGSYTVTGSQINITITNKPFFVSCSLIEGFLKSQLGG